MGVSYIICVICGDICPDDIGDWIACEGCGRTYCDNCVKFREIDEDRDEIEDGNEDAYRAFFDNVECIDAHVDENKCFTRCIFCTNDFTVKRYSIDDMLHFVMTKYHLCNTENNSYKTAQKTLVREMRRRHVHN